MRPTVLRLVLIATLAAWVVCGLGWLRLARQERELWCELAKLSASNRALEQELESVNRVEGAPPTASMAETEMPAERRKRRLLQLVETIKAERAKETRPRLPPPPSGPQGNVFQELMGDPEYARLAMIVWRYGERAQFSEAFRWAGVPEEKQSKLLELIHEVGLSSSDAKLVARTNGADNAAAQRAGWDAMAGVYAEMVELLGKETVARVTRAQGAVNGSNELVKALETRLSYTDLPLTPEQTRRVYDATFEEGGRVMLEPGQIESLVERLRPTLSASQLAAFRQVATEYNYGKKVIRRAVSPAESRAK